MGESLSVSPGLIVGLVSLLVALIGASSILVPYLVYRFYRPPITLDIQYPGKESESIEWWQLDFEEAIQRMDGDVTQPSISLSSLPNSPITLDKIEVHQHGDLWNPVPELSNLIERVGPSRYRIDTRLFTRNPAMDDSLPTESRRVISPDQMFEGGVAVIHFPFEARQTSTEFEITVYTSMSADQIELPVFGSLPRFFGEVDLRPVTASVTVRA